MYFPNACLSVIIRHRRQVIIVADVKPTELSLNDFMYFKQVCGRLVAQDIITQKQMDTTLDRIAKDLMCLPSETIERQNGKKSF